MRNSSIILAAAVTVASLGMSAKGAVNVGNGVGTEYIISTSGATALGAFFRAGDGTTFNRGPYSLGVGSLVIGDSTYTLDAGGQRLGFATNDAFLANEPGTNADRFVYNYHEIGSVNGVLDVAQAGGLLPAQSFPINATNPFWHMGTRINTEPAIGAPIAPTGGNPDGTGYLWQGKQAVRIAYSDVRAEAAFAVAGTASPSARPVQAGYGNGRDLPAGGTNYQKLTPGSSLVGGLSASTTRLRNEGLAVVPFTLSANPGTGLANVTEDDAKWLSATGRLANGANFNTATRDIGSGTRNQGGNNLGLDPSFASGERDRRNGDGTEKDPFAARTRNEDRPSAEATFGDKTSGSSQLRVSLIHSRMALGILSSGDVGSRGRSLTSTEPLRVLGIDFNEAPGETVAGAVQPTLNNVVSGAYQLWSAAQAVTVTPDGTTAATEPSKIKGDTDDDGSGTGIHRKFLNNITQSVANFGNPLSNQTPFDAIAAASFIPTAIMGVDKEFDGDTQVTRTRSAAEDAALATFQGQDINNATTLVGSLNWANPSSQNGNLGSSSLRFNAFAPGNTLASDTPANSNANADLSIDIEARTVLAGDFNGDTVRDLSDVEALALAYAAPARYLTTPTSGDANGFNYNGAEVASLESATTQRDTDTVTPGVQGALTFTAGQEGLVVLSDFNGNGNVTATGASTGTVAAVERGDVKYFLYGATVDTGSFSTAQAKREDGVRQGQLRKNAGIIRFNTALDGFVATVTNPATAANFTQGEVDALKFNRFDVNGDGVLNREDARYVDRNVGKNYTSFNDVLSTFDDLVAAELNDDNVISHVDPNTALASTGTVATLGNDSDFQQLRGALGAQLLDGDADINGSVNIDDFGVLAARFNTAAGRWTEADFNFDGSTNIDDFGLLAANFNQVAPAVGARGAAVPEPATVSVLAMAAGMIGRRRRSR